MLCPALCLTVLLCSMTFAAAPDSKPGDVIFQTDFEGPDALTGWVGSAKLAPGRNGGQCLFIERPESEGRGSTVAQLVLPTQGLGGCLMYLTGWIKAEGVSDRPQSWNGIKYMAPTTAGGAKSYPQAQIGTGTFNWQEVAFEVRIPEDVTDWRLYMGLEAVTGKVWFDDLKVWVRRGRFVKKPAVTEGEIYRGHALPRLRGAMISPRIDDASLKLFGEDWNANVVRWQIVGWRPQGNALDLDAYQDWFIAQLDKLDADLALCEKHGIYVVVDLHSPPSGGEQNLLNSKACQDRFIDNWRLMARRYKDSKVVWGYDLVNEPIERFVPEGVMDWQDLAQAAAKAVREIDPDHAIIVEPGTGGGPYGFTHLNPIDVPKVVYSCHMYLPHAFTHQGVHGEWTKQIVYPGEIDGVMWDKAQIERALKPAIDFQERYRVHMYIGEFSAIRWAPDNSAYRYLKDCIEVFEEHGWDWTYHAFREWSGWSVEHGPDKADSNPAVEPTDREKLLRDWFGRNEKPRW